MLLIPTLCFSQVDQIIDQKIDAKVQGLGTIVDAKINTFAKSIDSVIVKKTTQSGTFIIDTLSAPLNDVALYQISTTGFLGNTRVSCVKVILVANSNGAVSIARNTSLISFSGLNNGSFDAILQNNKVLVQIKSSTSNLQWTYKKITL